ncbi:unnamed protein product [Rotaria socialis]|uniref:Uncharacterized protein n=1 Tax=Rotaria socialis TaxID=392032 RepID=A0A818CUG7_9BILA|nr:unnamed protein product [Rotaria socialis]
MFTREIIPSGYYTRHRLPIMVNRLRPPTTPPIQSILVNLNGIREVSSPDLPMSDCDDSTRRIRASGAAGSFLTCCEWGMLAAIVLLSVGLAVAIFLLFTWPRSQMNDSDVANTCNGSSANTTSTTSVSSISSTTSPILTTSSQATTSTSTKTTSTSTTTTSTSTTTTSTSTTTIANTTRITFALQEDQYFYALDDVTVCDTASPSIQLLTNGDFETGSIVPWAYCNPSGSQYSGQVETGPTTVYGYPYVAYSGTNFYLDGAIGAPDYLSQTFSTTIGHTYSISFWLYNANGGTVYSVDVLMSI